MVSPESGTPPPPAPKPTLRFDFVPQGGALQARECECSLGDAATVAPPCGPRRVRASTQKVCCVQTVVVLRAT